MQVGRTMAMIRGVLTSQDGKTIYCTCDQHKVSVPTRPEHLKYRVEWDELWDKEGQEKAKL
jgi:acyl-coenzyme A thioesterase 13